MKKLKLMNAVFLETNTEAETDERALEVLQMVRPILDCQKSFWSRRIEKLFDEFVSGVDSPEELMNRKKDGLHWAFHRRLFKGMCDVYLGD